MDARNDRGDSAQRTAGSGDDPQSEDLALRRALLYAVVPFWLLPGVLDWYWHRRTKIEANAGTHESLTHVLMMGVVGGPVTAALLFDVNALVLCAMIVGAFVHEGISMWDVGYANGRREVTPIEQHTHSFLEVIPFAATVLAICLKPTQFAAIFGRGREPARWTLEPKRPALSARYVASVLGSVGAFVVLPYAEEFVRCYRTDGTLRPHPPA
ncbi:MAG: hypothetical protein NVS1B2_01430 [Vulcanimicrobiaceae bacterium]